MTIKTRVWPETSKRRQPGRSESLARGQPEQWATWYGFAGPEAEALLAAHSAHPIVRRWLCMRAGAPTVAEVRRWGNARWTTSVVPIAAPKCHHVCRSWAAGFCRSQGVQRTKAATLTKEETQ